MYKFVVQNSSRRGFLTVRPRRVQISALLTSASAASDPRLKLLDQVAGRFVWAL